MKILVLQLKRIGDLILTSPVLHALRENFPQAELALVSDAAARTLAETIPADRHWSVQRGAVAQGLLGLGPNAWIGRELIGYRADYCLDFTGTDRSALLARLSLSRRRVTYARFRKKFLRPWLYTDFVESSVRDRHTVDHHTALLRPLGVEVENVPLDLQVAEPTAIRMRTLLADQGVRQPFALIHAGTARIEKYWEPDRWARIAELLSATHGLTPVLSGSQDPAEQAHLAAIKAASRVDLVDISGRTDLPELAAVIQQAKIFCGVDTAAMHLADAMRTPTVALFGPTNPFHWRPRHTHHVVIRSRTTEPFQPGQKGGPMSEIGLDAVAAAVASLLR
jgi:predicted lipopolysaccharide heptosyltransferase III